MSGTYFSWDDFWAVYDDSPKEVQEEWLKQINLPDLVKRLSFKEVVKVFRCAPKEIVDEYLEQESDAEKKPAAEPKDESKTDYKTGYVPNFVNYVPPKSETKKSTKLPRHIDPEKLARQLIK